MSVKEVMSEIETLRNLKNDAILNLIEYFVVEEAPNGKLMGYSKCAALPRAEKWMHLMLALLLQSWARQRGTTRTGTGM